jgi:L-seryl-tRNA(Ser) seleniumtransferase
MKIQLLEESLRQAPTPVIGRVEEDRLLLDMRTVVEDEIELLAESLAAALSVET